MHICFTLSSLSGGGAERVATTISNYLCSEGHQVSIILVSIGYNNSFFDVDDKINVYPLLTDDNHGFLKRTKSLRQKILEIKPDIVVAFLHHICIYTYFALRKTNIPFICSERNNPHSYSIKYKFLLRRAFSKATGCVFQTNDARKYYFKETTNKKTVVIDNPVFLTANPNLCSKSSDTIDFVSVGRLVKQKNFIFLLRCFKTFSINHRNARLSIFGDGPLKNKIEREIARLGLQEKVFLKGMNNNWQNYLVESKCFISSSLYEGMPNCLEEALCLGVPSIATDCPIGGSKHLINTLGNGILVKTNNKKSMISAMNSILAFNQVTPDNAYLFSDRYICQKWLAFIEQVLNN